MTRPGRMCSVFLALDEPPLVEPEDDLFDFGRHGREIAAPVHVDDVRALRDAIHEPIAARVTTGSASGFDEGEPMLVVGLSCCCRGDGADGDDWRGQLSGFAVFPARRTDISRPS